MSPSRSGSSRIARKSPNIGRPRLSTARASARGPNWSSGAHLQRPFRGRRRHTFVAGGCHQSGVSPPDGLPIGMISPMADRRMFRAPQGKADCPCCGRYSVAVLCPACRRPLAYVRCAGLKRRWKLSITEEVSTDLWIDPVWEYRATGVLHLVPDPQAPGEDGHYIFGGPSITLGCTRACAATPSRQEADIVAAARLCLDNGLREFVLPG